MAKRFAQKEDVDYNETFFLVVRRTNSIKLVLSLIAHGGFKLEQLDVKTTYLHGDLDE